MADMDGLTEGKNYHLDKPQETEGFFLNGCGNLDWGMGAGSKFALHLFGSSGAQAVTIANEVTFDEFEICPL